MCDGINNRNSPQLPTHFDCYITVIVRVHISQHTTNSVRKINSHFGMSESDTMMSVSWEVWLMLSRGMCGVCLLELCIGLLMFGGVAVKHIQDAMVTGYIVVKLS